MLMYIHVRFIYLCAFETLSYRILGQYNDLLLIREINLFLEH